MNVLLCPLGSAGDVHPFLGVGEALARRGHRVTVVTNAYFRELVERVGLGFAEIGTAEEFLALSSDPDLWHLHRAFFYVVRNGLLPAMRLQYERIAELHVPGETLVVASCLGLGARIARDKLNVPLVTLHCQPSPMWSAYESPVLAGVRLPDWMPRWLKNALFRLAENRLVDPAICPGVNAFRAELGLPPVSRIMSRHWHSPDGVVGLFPAWFGAPQPDWPPRTVLTGFPLWDEGSVSTVPDDVAEFLAAGDPPIAFTPGSAMRFGRAFFVAAAEACRILGRRGMLLTRFAEHVPADLPSGVRHFEYVPFRRLLPRVAAVVHHGGIGSTSQGLAAGVPQLVMPMSHDQPDNAERLVRLGVGDYLWPAKFRGPAVAEKLRRLIESPGVRENCRTIAERFVGTDPLEETCDAVERMTADTRAAKASDRAVGKES